MKAEFIEPKWLDESEDSLVIYGICDKKTKELLYVGQTNDFESRRKVHFDLAISKFKALKHKMFVISTFPKKDINSAEKALIALFKKFGKCSLNKSKGTDLKRPMSYGHAFFHIPTKKYFPNMQVAAAYFGCSTTTVTNAKRVNSGNVFLEIGSPEELVFRKDPTVTSENVKLRKNSRAMLKRFYTLGTWDKWHKWVEENGDPS